MSNTPFARILELDDAVCGKWYEYLRPSYRDLLAVIYRCTRRWCRRLTHDGAKSQSDMASEFLLSGFWLKRLEISVGG